MNPWSSRPRTVLAAVALALLLAGCTGDPAPTAPASSPPPASPTVSAEPAGPACPAPPADSPSGAVDDPYSLGDTIVLDCFTIVVDAVDSDATEEISAANPGVSPGSGNVFMTVLLTITRSAGGEAAAEDVRVILAGSTSTSGEPTPSLTVTPPTPSGTLAEGQSVSGTYVFEMSGGASTSVELFVDDNEPINVLPY